MSQEIEIARQSARGGLVLFAGNLVSTVLNAAAVILIARLLGPADYGIYTLAILIPSTLQLFTGLGVNTAVMRYAPYYASVGREEDAKRLTRKSIEFHILTGSAFSLLQYIFSGAIATYVLFRPDMAPFLRLSSVYVFCQSVLLAGTASAVGWKWMSLASWSQVLQSVAKLVLAPALILIGLGVYGALAGQIVSPLFGGALAVALLVATRLHASRSAGPGREEGLSMMVRFGLPAYSGMLLNGLASSFLIVVLAYIAENSVVGFFQVAVNFVTPILLISTATANALVPAFASLDGTKGNLRVALNRSMKYVAAAMMPATVFLAAAAGPLVGILYGPSFVDSIGYLRLLAVSMVPVAMGFVVFPVYFNGTGKTRRTLVVYATRAVSVVVLAPLLALSFGLGIPGIIYAYFASYSLSSLSGAVLAKKEGSSVAARSLLAMLFASAVSYLASFWIPEFVRLTAVALLAQLAVFFMVFVTLVPLLEALDGPDLDTLERSLGHLWLVGPFASLFLRYERALLRSKGGAG